MFSSKACASLKPLAVRRALRILIQVMLPFTSVLTFFHFRTHVPSTLFLALLRGILTKQSNDCHLFNSSSFASLTSFANFILFLREVVEFSPDHCLQFVLRGNDYKHLTWLHLSRAFRVPMTHSFGEIEFHVGYVVFFRVMSSM